MKFSDIVKLKNLLIMFKTSKKLLIIKYKNCIFLAENIGNNTN